MEVLEAHFGTSAEPTNTAEPPDTHVQMSQEAGYACMQVVEAIRDHKPDVVYLIGDRYEVAGVALGASLMNCIIAHQMGGEVSGTIDEHLRHAISKLAHIHFPATVEAGLRLRRLGEPPDRIHVVGCPRIDLARIALLGYSRTCEDFVLVCQHPVTTEPGMASHQMRATLEAALRLDIPVVCVPPNSDAGRNDVWNVIESYGQRIQVMPNVDPFQYARLMHDCAVMIGNSSSGLREGAWIGTPYVLVGSRQRRREWADNVVTAALTVDDLVAALKERMTWERKSSDLYGDGFAAQRIAKVLVEGELPPVQKEMWE